MSRRCHFSLNLQTEMAHLRKNFSKHHAKEKYGCDLPTLGFVLIDTPSVFRCKHQCFTPMVLKSVVDASLITFGS